MRRAIRRTVIASCAMLLLASAAFGEEEEAEDWLPGSLAGNVAYATDYSFRGISQTQRDMAFQGGLDWTHDIGFHLGLWSSTIKFRGDKSYLEQDFYGGFAKSFGDFSFDLLAVYYFYPMSDDFNYGEAILNLAYDFGFMKVTLGGVGSNDYLGYTGTGGYGNAGINVPLPIEIPYFDLAIDTKAGYSRASDPIYANDEDYWDWSGALVATLPFNLSLDFRYVGTDIKTSDYGNADAGDRFIFTAKYAF